MYVERVTKDAITKMQAICHLYLRVFINLNVLNVGFLIYMYIDRVIPRVVLVSCQGLNTLFNITYGLIR